MKPGELAVFLGCGALLLYLVKNNGSDNANSLFDLSYLTNDPGDLQRLNNFYSVLQQQGLTDVQQQFILSQALHESGILTDVANYYNIDQLNNWTGIKHGGVYASYPDLQTFFNEYMQILSKGVNPLGATSSTDFVHRLKQNGYFEDSEANYLAAFNKYFHQLYLSSL